ncbi:MAG: helix-turn-helix transcriptional regulator [Lachnospiraceae bacterium]|nr:helix-turn-helix transcriptional regulator [Lachnospiraceae bacterium]
MGYGANLKKILDEKGITIKQLARKTGIAPTTLYSIVQRDASVRYDSAIKIAGFLDIPISAICKDNPYDDIETLPELKLGLGISESKSKQSHISYRTAEIIKKFDFQELPMVDQLIADLYVLDTRARKDLFSYLKTLKDNYSEPDKVEEIKKIKYKW